MASFKFTVSQRLAFATIVVVALIQLCASQQKFCGPQLNEALKMICRNKYMVPGKRAVAISEYYDDETFNFETFETMPFVNKLYAGALSPNIRRIKQGIVNECCKKPCTWTELSAYCFK